MNSKVCGSGNESEVSACKFSTEDQDDAQEDVRYDAFEGSRADSYDGLHAEWNLHKFDCLDDDK